MLSNDMKEGMEITMTGGRKGWIRDNKKGIIRTVEVEVPGQGSDFGSCYINEIRTVNGELHEISKAHLKQLSSIGLW